MLMMTLVIVVVVLTVGAVMIVGIVRGSSHHEEASERHVDPIAASAIAFGQSIAQSAMSGVPPIPPVHPSVESATPSVVTSAAPVTPSIVPAPHRYGGTRASLSSSDFSNCTGCDWERFRTDLHARDDGALSACFAASEHEPPHHETPYYEIGVSASGAFTSFTTIADGAPHLDRCLQNLVFGTPLHKASGGAGSFKLGFKADCTPGMTNLPGSCK
jgi:hypothetical protein